MFKCRINSIRKFCKKAALMLMCMSFLFIAACRDDDSDAARFRKENEILNGQVSRDGQNYHKTLSIPRRNPFVFVDGYQVYDMLTTPGRSGIIYMGFPECPWCRALLPSLIDAVRESGWRGSVYHYNGLADRDILRLDDYGEIEVLQEGQQIYHQLVELLYDYLGPYIGLEDETIKRIYFPTTVFFRDGVVTSVHLGTIPSQTNGWEGLNDEQAAELKEVLIAQIREIM